jgi:hypothetical protein
MSRGLGKLQRRALEVLASAEPKKLAWHTVNTTSFGELEWHEFKYRVLGRRAARYGYRWNQYSVAVDATVTEVSNLRRAILKMEKRGLVAWREVRGIQEGGRPWDRFSVYTITSLGRAELSRAGYVNLKDHGEHLGSLRPTGCIDVVGVSA